MLVRFWGDGGEVKRRGGIEEVEGVWRAVMERIALPIAFRAGTALVDTSRNEVSSQASGE